MENLVILFFTIVVFYYLFRPISKKEEIEFKNKSNWRGGF